MYNDCNSHVVLAAPNIRIWHMDRKNAFARIMYCILSLTVPV